MADDVRIEFMVPVRNGGPLLAECLQSVLDQTETRLRVHVVDNASTDETPEIVQRFSDPRLTYHRFDEGASLPGNFNRCMDLASAPIFALVHADDRLLPDFATAMLRAAHDFPDAGIIFCKGVLIDETGVQFRPIKQRIKDWIHDRRGSILQGQKGLELVASYNHLMAPCAVYRTDAIPKDLRYPEGFHYLTDQSFWLTALTAGVQFAQISTAHYEHRVHRSQLSGTLRSAGTTLEEVRRFTPHGPDPVRLHRIWQRYGAKLALRQAIVCTVRGRMKEAASGLHQMVRFLRDSYRREG